MAETDGLSIGLGCFDGVAFFVKQAALVISGFGVAGVELQIL
jgi:hypothetical protein